VVGFTGAAAECAPEAINLEMADAGMRPDPPGLLKVVGSSGALGPLKITACGLSSDNPTA
jgi:hypothetical protein